MHFDVGNKYQNPRPSYIIPSELAAVRNTTADDRQSLPEAATCPGTGCRFPQYPGTVGWKTAYRFVRDQLLHFPYSRKDVFHHALFAHTLGVASAKPDVPKSTSGVSDLLGGDLMVTLGLWDDKVGTDFAQAATLFHELGHNLALRHGGASQIPNCKPNYLSSMNYLFQMGGLLNKGGVPQIDFSRQALPTERSQP